MNNDNIRRFPRLGSMSELAREHDELTGYEDDYADLYEQHVPFHGSVGIEWLDTGSGPCQYVVARSEMPLTAEALEAASNLVRDELARAMAKLQAAEAAMKARQLKTFQRISGLNKHGGTSALPGAGVNQL